MPTQHNLIPVTYRTPFDVGHEPWRDVREHGQSILEIVQSVPDLPRGFIDRGGVVCINGEVVPRNLWALVRPKATSDVLPITVTLHWPLQSPGGGGGGGRSTTKSIIGIVAAIALIAVTAFLTAGGSLAILGALGVTGAALTIGAPLLTAAVGIAGALAISALTAPPTTQPAAQIANDTNSDNRDPAGANGNTISPGGSIPRVIGTRKVYPPFICEPIVQLVNTEDETVECVVALNGPHSIDDIKIDNVSISDVPPGIEVETSSGTTGSSSLLLVQRQGRTTNLQISLSQHKLQSDDTSLLGQDLNSDLPIWHRMTTFDSPDVVWIHLLFPGGVTNNAGTDNIGFPFRMRMRKVGDSSWINFPEFHFAQKSARPLRRQIRILWTASPLGSGVGSFDPAQRDWYYARHTVPQQTDPPTSGTTGTTWAAHSYFTGGPGSNDFVWYGNEGSTKLSNMTLTQDSAVFYIEPDTFTPGRYEIELIRGSAYTQSNFGRNLYIIGPSPGIGDVRDFFGAVSFGPYVTAMDQTGMVSTAALVRIVSVWNEHPVSTAAQDKFAFIAIRAKNRQLNRISCIATGLVPQWNGSSWITTGTGSSNPAMHYRDVLLGAQNHDPVDSTQVDNDGIVAWANLCTSHQWSVDAIIDDMRTQDALELIASCGYARPYQSDLYGVTVDNDRSADDPVQVFSRINTIGMKYDKAFARVPSGLIINYRRITKDYDNDQEIVLQTDPSVGVTGLYETITYDGIVRQGGIQARGKFDLDQANLRSTFYSFETDIESLVCRRGSLVAVQHDIMTSRMGDAHIKTVLTSGGNITGFVLDAQIDFTGTTGVAIRRSAGAVSVHQVASESHGSNGGGSTIMLSSPFAIPSGGTIVGYDDTNDEYGCLVVTGDLGSEYQRMLVFSITPTKDLRANVVLVDEAQGLVRFGE